MQILSVTLQNFKTHRDRHVTFSPGTNAICGENGAGKTSILEAIAWTLFNYQGGYAKEDLIRNGTGSAEVTVEFISHQDHRTYVVQRHTHKGYTLFDPQLQQRLPYSRIKDEVLPWLREHLGVAPGTDLGELFARTIGVPQGTFTADFLQSPEHRKTVFDRVLKVDEYKTVHRELNSLRRYAEAQVEAVEHTLASYEERLTTWEDLQTRHQTLAQTVQENQAQLATLTTQIDAIQQEQAVLTQKAAHMHQLQSQWQQAQSQLDGQQQAIILLQQSLDQARQAASLCAAKHPAYAAYQAAEAQLQALTQQQQQRQQLQKRLQKLQKTLTTRASDIARLQGQLDDLAAAAAEIEALQPKVQEQAQLETQLRSQQQQQTALAQVRGELQATENTLGQLDQQLARTRQTLKRLQTLATQLADLPQLEQQRERLQQQLSRVEAARQFEQELQSLVVQGQTTGDRYQAQATAALATLGDLQQTLPPLAAAAITTLKTAIETGLQLNQTTLAQVQQILDDLTPQTNPQTLKDSLTALQKQLKQRQQQQTTVATRPEHQQQLTHYQTQQATLTARIQALQHQLTAEPELQTQIAALQTALATLADPRSRCAVLARSQPQQPSLHQRYTEMVAAQSGIQTQLTDLEQQLQTFDSLDAAMAEHTQLKQQHQTDYRQYLQFEHTAQGQERLEQELAAAQQTLVAQQQTRDRLQAELAAAQAEFDPAQAAQITATAQTLRSQYDRLTGSLPQQQQLLAELQRQLAELKDIAEKRDSALQERKKRDRIKRFINFARRAYKEAGPRITERYVQQVSREADRLFRDLINRQNVALTWTRDYDIQVQEGPNSRRFINLSGGEQMCAALAVRLALLKVLADIDIAFFDEPTTNMDRPRRESLADAIARIKSFTQLFVISHDDTFEKVTENVIFIEREE